MPKEYIDRDVVIETIKRVYCTGCNSYNGVMCRACQIDDAILQIDAEPAADVAPVVHGKIIETLENGRCKRVFSCCGTDFTQLTKWIIPHHCPNCGAKMDGGGHGD